MHPAKPFHVRDETVLLDHLGQHPFVTLAAQVSGVLRIAQTPVVIRRLASGLALDFHLSRGNALTPAFAEGFRAVAVSLGPDVYVSPDWYVLPGQVPTWNYISVEAEGLVTAMGDDGLIALLDDLSAQEEARLAPKPAWTRGKMAPGRFEAMMGGIAGARLTVERLEGTFKLSQNKPDSDIAGVAAALGDHPIGGLMRRGG